jgi:hypothetical protein
MSRVGVVGAEELVARLDGTPAASSVELGYRPGLLWATLTELAEEQVMREVIACSWAVHLGVADTPDAYASSHLAAIADVVDRLVGLAAAIQRCVGATWVIDPDEVAFGYAPSRAPIATVGLLGREVRLAPLPHDGALNPREAARPGLWPALVPLVASWCQDGHLDPEVTSRTLGWPTTGAP